ncbi:MAG TPA: DUF4142 domain-containing protein [Pseudoxanthomonas sp.]|nr:DUF4142 domain-containing protein [Pseudoxanthomonas sp.]
MKTSLLAMSLLTLALATACDRRDDTDNAPKPDAATADASAMPATDPTAAAPADSMAPAAAPATDDALALGLLSAVDDHEIQAAQQAIAKPVTGAVLEYARMMEKQHTDNLVETKTIGPVGDSPEVQAMKDKGASELAELGKKSGKEYETAYVEAMVKDHTEALALIDGRMLSLASAGAVRDHVSKARDHVAKHLEEAQKLQSKPAS